MMTMPEAMKEATYALLQRGDKMQTKDPVHPPAVCDITNVYDTYARAFQSDSKRGTVSNSHVQTGAGDICPDHQKRAIQMQQQKNPRYVHQPNVHTVPCYCCYAGHPGKNRPNKRKRAHSTSY